MKNGFNTLTISRNDANEVVDLSIEQQRFGDSHLRLTEGASIPLIEKHYEILSIYELQLQALDLKITVGLDFVHQLHAGNRVGTHRFESPDNSYLIVQVDPKVKSADIFRMLDRTNRAVRLGSSGSDISTGEQPVSGIFLQYFASYIKSFLTQRRFRTYRYVDQYSPGHVKGRILTRDYVLRNIPTGKEHILPSRYLDFSADVFENQVIAFSIHLASQLVTVLRLAENKKLVADLGSCKRLLVGVSPKRVTARELSSYRYSRATAHFRRAHDLCLVLMQNETISFDAGDRIPFASFSLNMPNLFERYVSSVLKESLGNRFIGRKEQLEFQTDFGAKPVKLDGMIVDGSKRIVIESKYRTLNETDDELVLGLVPEKHVYQTVAYCTHNQIQASQALIVYPNWDENGSHVRLSSPITDFGWSPGNERHLTIRLLGISLSSAFNPLVALTSSLIEPLISAE